jgi:neutral ceramidase
MTYLAGVGRRDITPPTQWIDAERIWLWGFGDRTARCPGVLDPLDVRALAVRDDLGATAVLVSADLGALAPASTNRIGERVAAEHGIAGEYVCVNVSHTHSAPVFASIPTWQPGVALADDSYVQFVEDAVAGAVADALADLRPALLEFGRSTTGIAYDPSPDGHPDGPDARRRAGDRTGRHPDRGRVRGGLPPGRAPQRRQPRIV